MNCSGAPRKPWRCSQRTKSVNHLPPNGRARYHVNGPQQQMAWRRGATEKEDAFFLTARWHTDKWTQADVAGKASESGAPGSIILLNGSYETSGHQFAGNGSGTHGRWVAGGG